MDKFLNSELVPRQKGPWPDSGRVAPPLAHFSLCHKSARFCLFDLLAFWLVNCQSFYMERK